MATLTIGKHGEIELPDAVRDRYGLQPDTPVRIVETRSGVLLVPLTDEPMDPDLAGELEAWQSLSTETWDQFSYEDAQQ